MSHGHELPKDALQRARKISSIEQIAQWSLSHDPAFSAPLSLRQSGLILLDSIGCMLAAQRSKTAGEVVQLVAELGGAPHCTVVGQPFKSSAPNAVLANGALVRALDLNDVMFIQKEGHLSVGGHCSDNIPVVMAIGEMVNASLRQVLEAFVMAGDTSAEAWLKALLQTQQSTESYGRRLLMTGQKPPVALKDVG
ncbi:MAG: hypothetical protein EBY21_10925, partial [Alphaproteobacteria bacterium]|nr:hypothetical protein [Alphaproteobacteria bacterium]